VLPALAVGSAAGAAVAKQTRALIIEASTSDAVRYARACGLPERQISRLKIRLALPGLVTFIAISFIAVLGGSALIELIFAWGGAGQYALQAITLADFSAVQGYVLAMGTIGAIVYLAADFLVLLIDPRVHHG
jgi:ABC-type dipeptide/oligopeptide/nickel transport system permease component